MSQPETAEPTTEADISTPVAEAEIPADQPLPRENPPQQDTNPSAVLEAEAARWKDLALRNAAELDNYRKRVARDMQETRAYGNSDLLRSLFPILDNFEMGLEAARAENEKSMIFLGLSMVKRQLADFLRDQGVDEVNADSGVTFDPNLHEAVSQEASDAVPDGAIIRVTRRGFKLKDRLLRPATVVVSSGPANAAGA